VFLGHESEQTDIQYRPADRNTSHSGGGEVINKVQQVLRYCECERGPEINEEARRVISRVCQSSAHASTSHYDFPCIYLLFQHALDVIERRHAALTKGKVIQWSVDLIGGLNC